MTAYYPTDKAVHPDFSIPRDKPLGDVEIDWDNPLTVGLKRCWLFEPQTNLRDIVNDRSLVMEAGTSRMKVLSGDMAGQFVSSRMVDLYGDTGILGSSKRTVFGVIRNANNSVNGVWVSLGLNVSAQRFTIRNDDTNFRVELQSSGSTVTTVADLRDDNFHSFGVSLRGVDLSSCRWFVDGEFGVFSGATVINTANEDILFHTNTIGGSSSTKDWKICYVWNRDLSDGELISLNESPYQILRPKQAHRFIVPEFTGVVTVDAKVSRLTLNTFPTTSITDSDAVVALLTLNTYPASIDLIKEGGNPLLTLKTFAVTLGNSPVVSTKVARLNLQTYRVGLAVAVLSNPTSVSPNTTITATVDTDTGTGLLYSLTQTGSAETDPLVIIANGRNQPVNIVGTQTVLTAGASPSTQYFTSFVQVVTGNSNVVSANSTTGDAPIGGATMTLNDAILAATGGPTIAGGLAAWYGKTPSETINGAEFRWLGEQGATAGTNSGRWFEYLGSLGYTGANNDRQLQYWLDQIVQPVDPPLFTGSIANMTSTDGTPMTPVDVSGNFSTGGAVTSYSLQNAPAWMAISAAGVITGTPTAVALTAGITVTGSNATAPPAVSNTFSMDAQAAAGGLELTWNGVDSFGSFTALAGMDAYIISFTINFTTLAGSQYVLGRNNSNDSRIGKLSSGALNIRGATGDIVNSVTSPFTSTGVDYNVVVDYSSGIGGALIATVDTVEVINDVSGLNFSMSGALYLARMNTIFLSGILKDVIIQDISNSLTYEWAIDSGSTVSEASLQDPLTLTFNNVVAGDWN